MNHERVFRALALGDIEREGHHWQELTRDLDHLDHRDEAFVRLSALIALGASEPSIAVAMDRAVSAGVTSDEVVAMLVALAPTVGTARLIEAAPAIALGLGIDVDHLLELG